MSDNIIDVTDASFETEVVGSSVPVLVDFWAPWCGPCLALAPTLEAVAPHYAGRLKIAKINCDEAKALCDRFSVRGIPHLMLFSGGQQIGAVLGRTRTRLMMELDGLLK